jgi:hypothetical protein
MITKRKTAKGGEDKLIVFIVRKPKILLAYYCNGIWRPSC